MKYFVITNTDEEDLAKEVDGLLKVGYKLHGGVAVAVGIQVYSETSIGPHGIGSNFWTTYAQAMIKEEPNATP